MWSVLLHIMDMDDPIYKDHEWEFFLVFLSAYELILPMPLINAYLSNRNICIRQRSHLCISS